MASELGHILFVAIKRDPPPAVCIRKDFHVKTINSKVSGVARHVEELGVTPEYNRRIKPSPGVLYK